MTVRVVREPEREVACTNCRSVLAYDMDDTKIGWEGANWGGDTRTQRRYVLCPKCEHPAWVEEAP